jgi:hypothetical protein
MRESERHSAQVEAGEREREGEGERERERERAGQESAGRALRGNQRRERVRACVRVSVCA